MAWRFFKAILFGNYLYGLSAVFISIESTLILQNRFNHYLFYFILFCSSTLYYSFAYRQIKQTHPANERADWYFINQKHIQLTQRILFISIVLCTSIYIYQFNTALKHLPVAYWLLIAFFPLIAFLYYGYFFPGFNQLSIRQWGWIKPFIIGFTWSGIVTIYPVIASKLEQTIFTPFNLFDWLLFLKNWMFITVLCIMFDIKDYAADHNHQVKTFVVRYGLRKTIFYIIIPLVIAGFISFLAFAWFNHFSIIKILLNTIPFCLLLYVAYSLQQRRSIQYYLAVIDGQMLVKAICGIIAVKFF